MDSGTFVLLRLWKGDMFYSSECRAPMHLVLQLCSTFKDYQRNPVEGMILSPNWVSHGRRFLSLTLEVT